MTNKNCNIFPISPFILSPFWELQRLIKLAAKRVVTPLANSRSVKRVLAYLRDMAEFATRLRRRDMFRYYDEAWEFAAQHIYGRFPAEKPLYAPAAPWVPPAPVAFEDRPRWFQVKYSCPYRKIVERVTDNKSNPLYELLVCGHKNRTNDFSGSSESEGWAVARGRRCKQCGDINLAKLDAKLDALDEQINRDLNIRKKSARSVAVPSIRKAAVSA